MDYDCAASPAEHSAAKPQQNFSKKYDLKVGELNPNARYARIKRDVRDKVSNSMCLRGGELPRGEHGTYHDKDRIVAFMSDYDFGVKEITNTMVPLFIKKLME